MSSLSRYGFARNQGVTMIETVVVTLIVSLVLGGLMLLLSRSFFGSRKGFDTLSVLQEESKMVAYLKHDFRTLIMGNGISGPTLTSDAHGIVQFEFFKVETADSFGRPIPVKIRYRRTGGTVQARALDGTMKPAYSLERSDGTTSKEFMPSMISDLRLTFLDRAGVDAQPAPLTTRKVRIELENFSSELLQTTISIYSPYVGRQTAAPDSVWMPNYHQQSYTPGAMIETYNGDILDSSDLSVIGPAVALNRERRF